mmetsp:Transcript_30670/g.65282  ORF Transcript_30670/g.65282 Transcript_30670/m.65282 type:complete len:174 (+) Transcript_30670:100-621(+)
MQYGYDEESEHGEEDEEGFSKTRLCVGLCGVLPSTLWVLFLGYLISTNYEAECQKPGNIVMFMVLSAASFAVIVFMEIVEGCYAGEPDFKMSPIELGTNLVTALAAIFVYCWNYYGVIQLVVGDQCDPGLKYVGWVTLIGNNIVWFLTLATTIAAQVASFMYAGADLALGDRL